MHNPKITGKDIAKMLGVSPTAISLVKNKKEGVSDKTRKQIIKVMKETGYYDIEDTDNTTKNIVILHHNEINTFRHSFFSEISNSILLENLNFSYNLIISTVDYGNPDATFPKSLNLENTHGIIFLGDPCDPLLLQIKEKKIPFVILDSSRQSYEFPSVRADYKLAAYIAVNHLVELGHRNIAFIGNNNRHFAYEYSVLTFGGFQKAVAEHGLSPSMQHIQFDANTEERLHFCIDNVMSAQQQPTALFCNTDYNALLAIQYLWNKGIRVPDDLSIIGIDDLGFSRYTAPPLTTVRVNREQIGVRGLHMIDNILNGVKTDDTTIYVSSPELIVRKSTSPLLK